MLVLMLASLVRTGLMLMLMSQVWSVTHWLAEVLYAYAYVNHVPSGHDSDRSMSRRAQGFDILKCICLKSPAIPLVQSFFYVYAYAYACACVVSEDWALPQLEVLFRPSSPCFLNTQWKFAAPRSHWSHFTLLTCVKTSIFYCVTM